MKNPADIRSLPDLRTQVGTRVCMQGFGVSRQTHTTGAFVCFVGSGGTRPVGVRCHTNNVPGFIESTAKIIPKEGSKVRMREQCYLDVDQAQTASSVMQHFRT